MDVIDSGLLKDIGIGAPINPDGPRSRSADELGVDDFLQLMLAQVRNQDPFEPTANGEFISQMAEFGTVSGIDDMKTSLDQLSQSFVSNQTLQAAGLIGRNVEVPVNRLEHDAGDSHSIGYELPNGSSSVRVHIFDAAGSLVNSVDLGAQGPGAKRFNWDGTDINGNLVTAGQFGIAVEALISGKTEALNTYAEMSVVSVSLSEQNRGISLELENGDSIALNQVREIR